MKNGRINRKYLAALLRRAAVLEEAVWDAQGDIEWLFGDHEKMPRKQSVAITTAVGDAVQYAIAVGRPNWNKLASALVSTVQGKSKKARHDFRL